VKNDNNALLFSNLILHFSDKVNFNDIDSEVLTKLYSVGEKHSINISSRSDVEQVKEKITRIYQHYNDISHIQLEKLNVLTDELKNKIQDELKNKIPENSSKERIVENIINYYADWEGGSKGKGPNRSTIINIINNPVTTGGRRKTKKHKKMRGGYLYSKKSNSNSSSMNNSSRSNSKSKSNSKSRRKKILLNF
jgi:hypothetical protein